MGHHTLSAGRSETRPIIYRFLYLRMQYRQIKKKYSSQTIFFYSSKKKTIITVQIIYQQILLTVLLVQQVKREKTKSVPNASILCIFTFILCIRKENPYFLFFFQPRKLYKKNSRTVWLITKALPQAKTDTHLDLMIT